MRLDQSRSIFAAAKEIIPGGVNSPVRAYRSVGGTPVHMARGEGAHAFDVDGNRYIDLVMSYGPLILGHCDPRVVKAIQGVAATGTCFGTPSRGELEIAREIVARVPGCGMVRLVNSGTEATMSVLRLARACTGREVVLKFDGCYHGHGDSFLVKAGSGALTNGAPDSPGVPAKVAGLTLVARYNDLAHVAELMEAHGREVACMIVEPIVGNIGLVKPKAGFLAGLLELCRRHGALLVFDEVMTGFRVARGGAAELHGVVPDLYAFGKVIGGGLPVGAYGGRKDLMSRVSPAGDVYQAGTLSGNPLSVAAGLATLRACDEPGFHARLEVLGARLQAGLEAAAARNGVPIHVGREGSMICPYISNRPVDSLESAMASDRALWTRFFHAMLENGVHLPPSPFESWFLSIRHDEAVVDAVSEAADRSFAAAMRG
jgi:glutamate-1-semialdehyde 2,1-aminomutase